MLKLLRAIRFDGTDERVFDAAAAPGEWAVSGAFAFAHLEPPALTGKVRQAFANGFLGTGGFGRSTFATVGEATPAEVAGIEDALAGHLIARYGAPDRDAALAAAREEIAFIADLCQDLAINTVLTVRRRHDVTGAVREEFRTIAPPPGGPPHARIWTVEDDGA